ncbi:hypothetical protein GCM10010357_17710 [Streptomyces luteireticuli]|uniref:Recombinase family protein n=1 Tax=Streptomyces luteireticuli TaxID=173858 RepID=A0ABN0YK85_9ACTN
MPQTLRHSPPSVSRHSQQEGKARELTDAPARRRNIANAASYPNRVSVVLYARVGGDSCPDVALAHARRFAEAQDWDVHSAFFDVCGPTTPGAGRQFWPKVERLLLDREVEGVVALSEDEIAGSPEDKAQFKELLLTQAAFVEYVGEPPFGSAAGEPPA